MDNANVAEQWARVDRLLDRVLAVAPADRAAFVEAQTVDDPRLRLEVMALLAEFGTRNDFLDRPAMDAVARRSALIELQPGHRIGAYRILSLLGRGGMGEVYRAERADDQFEQQVALKLLRHDAVEHLGRFIAERRILARLQHPGIARLYDAGITDDRRPYMVMELVEGVPITDWCRDKGANLQARLALFLQACDAVAYAHRNLVIHRDLKPENVMVDGEGQVKLLDFGVAKLLAGNDAEPTRGAPMTLAYAAPEQLMLAPVSTATDVYALGVLLFQLLTDRLPWATHQLPVAIAIDKMLHETAPAPSAAAADNRSAPVPVRLLTGDLDAVVGKALRKEPTERYATVAGLQADVRRHLRGEPVHAREGARWYVFGCFMRRYRMAATSVAVLMLALAAGLAGTTWQARRAEREAARATATKDFLLGIFSANDPRIATDKPRGEITARELLDIGTARIERDFAGQPELQIELLGTTAAIYGNLSDEERYAAVQKRRMQLARAHYGPAHPVVIEGMVSEADAACLRQDYARANRLLAETDVLLESSGQDDSLLRADWWRTKARALGAVANAQAARRHALDQAIALYARLAPHSNGYAAALNMAARDRSELGDHVQARRFIEQALAAAESAPDRDDALIGVLHNNLARKLEKLGEFGAAESAYQRAEEMAKDTYGTRHATYWLTLAYHARMLHQRGQRERANLLFARMLSAIPPDWKTNNNDKWAREMYAESLVAEGRAGEAIPLLDASQRSYLEKTQYEYDLREVRLKLGDAYDRVGRTAEARKVLAAAREEYLATEAPGSLPVLRMRERWARFLLDHPASGDADLASAEAELRIVLATAASQSAPESAMAHAGLARIASAGGDNAIALRESRQALAAIARVQGLYDVRLQPRLWLLHSNLLLGSGDATGARQWAAKALEASRRYDDPSSAGITDAEAAVRVSTAALGRAGARRPVATGNR